MYPDQIQAAAQLPQGANPQDEPWAPSVKDLLQFPQVLSMMNGDPGWTSAVGQAFANQPGDVNQSIQRLRAEANANQPQVVNYGFVYQPNPYYTYIPVGYDVRFVDGHWADRRVTPTAPNFAAARQTTPQNFAAAPRPSRQTAQANFNRPAPSVARPSAASQGHKKGH
jgi:hypothetical protein